MWTAAILAGGRARRMGGREKAMLMVGGRSVLDRQVAVLRDVAEHIILVTSDRNRFAGSDVPVVVDNIPDIGPLGGLHTAISSARTERVLAVACDMPFLTVPFLKRLRSAGEDVDLVMLRTAEGQYPLCATIAKSCTEAIGQLVDEGVRRLAALADQPGIVVRILTSADIAPFDPDGRALFNINTPDDYTRAIAIEREWTRKRAHSDRSG
jgi:molybdopterin-guanine dinucleotide biosynthesis protein A